MSPRAHGRFPHRITNDSGPWPLHAGAAAKALEVRALARGAPGELMERAGLAVAKLARALAPSARQVQVWCGPGNNGGDGYVAARWLSQSSTAVRLIECGTPGNLPADAARARELALAAGLTPHPAEEHIAEPPDLVIDALLGLGATRPPAGGLASAIACINAQRATVLAVDLPSGLQPDTGQPMGDAVVRAHHTLSLLSLKPGLFTGAGRDLAGAVWFDELGCHDNEDGAAAWAPTARLLGPAVRSALPHASHKGRRGDVWVVGGAAGMVGAARLAARAALAAGAGRVYLSVLSEGPDSAIDANRPELMHRPYSIAGPLLRLSATVVAGCGGSEAVRDCLPALLSESSRLVLDADALNHVAREPALMRLLRGRAGRGQATVLTPHPLEAARLLGTDSATVQAHRLLHAATLAERTQAVVVLKGSGTVLAAPGTLPSINPSGHAALATAGTGDVLAGWLGGLWAQAPEASPFELACAATWQHGHAADVARPPAQHRGAPLLADDLIVALADTV